MESLDDRDQLARRVAELRRTEDKLQQRCGGGLHDKGWEEGAGYPLVGPRS
jgi:hypothetical protein